MVPRAGAVVLHKDGAPPAGEGGHRALTAVQEPQEPDVFFSQVASGEDFFFTEDRIGFVVVRRTTQ